MWQLDGTLATLRSEQMGGFVELQQPHCGIQQLAVHAKSEHSELPNARLLQVALPSNADNEVIRDSWVRGSDLVAVYSPTNQRASQPEIYWRHLVSDSSFGLELIVSVQTGLLDDHPQVRVVSILGARDGAWISGAEERDVVPISRAASGDSPFRAAGPGACLVRWPSPFSYVEMIHPSDFCQLALSWNDDRIAVQTELFPERLEKGVIRRARIRGWFVPASEDLQTARRLYHEFAQSKLPLTT